MQDFEPQTLVCGYLISTNLSIHHNISLSGSGLHQKHLLGNFQPANDPKSRDFEFLRGSEHRKCFLRLHVYSFGEKIIIYKFLVPFFCLIIIASSLRSFFPDCLGENHALEQYVEKKRSWPTFRYDVEQKPFTITEDM